MTAEEMQARMAEMQAAIDAFCDKQEWAVEAWKRQPVIAELYRLCSKVPE